MNVKTSNKHQKCSAVYLGGQTISLLPVKETYFSGITEFNSFSPESLEQKLCTEMQTNK